jgi:hypothetical protein
VNGIPEYYKGDARRGAAVSMNAALGYSGLDSLAMIKLVEKLHYVLE